MELIFNLRLKPSNAIRQKVMTAIVSELSRCWLELAAVLQTKRSSFANLTYPRDRERIDGEDNSKM